MKISRYPWAGNRDSSHRTRVFGERETKREREREREMSRVLSGLLKRRERRTRDVPLRFRSRRITPMKRIEIRLACERIPRAIHYHVTVSIDPIRLEEQHFESDIVKGPPICFPETAIKYLIRFHWGETQFPCGRRTNESEPFSSGINRVSQRTCRRVGSLDSVENINVWGFGVI